MDLLRFAYLVCGDRHRGEDLLQDVLLAMHRQFGDTLPIANPYAYARRAVVNANINWSRRATNRELVIEAVPDRLATVERTDPADRDEL